MSSDSPPPAGSPPPPGTEDERVLRLDLPAAHSAVRMARAVVRRFAERLGLEGDELETLVLVASELLANAVDHGGGGAAMDEEDLVEPVRMGLFLELKPALWILAVEDEGGGDPTALRGMLTSDDPPDLEDERGRGLFLLRSLADAWTVEARPGGHGLVLRAVRRHARDV